jgi:hypothetical protein
MVSWIIVILCCAIRKERMKCLRNVAHIIIRLQPFVEPWPLFQFLGPIYSRQDSLDGGSAFKGLYLHREQHKHRINARNTDIHFLSRVRTHDPSVRVSKDNSCLRPRGQCDRHTAHIQHANVTCDLHYICCTYTPKYSYISYAINCVYKWRLLEKKSHLKYKNVRVPWYFLWPVFLHICVYIYIYSSRYFCSSPGTWFLSF